MPSFPTQVRHSHNLHDQCRPPRKMLRPLPCSGLRIILLPREPRLLPTIVHSMHYINAESCIEFLCALLVRAGLVGGVFLVLLSEMRQQRGVFEGVWDEPGRGRRGKRELTRRRWSAR